MFTRMTPLVFKKPPGTLLVSLTSWKCCGAKLVKKALLLMTAGCHQHKNRWYLPPLGFCSSGALHRALQGAKPPHIGPKLMAGFGRGRCMHLSPRTSRVYHLQNLHSWLPALLKLLPGSPHPHFSQLCTFRKRLLRSSFASNISRLPVLQSLSPGLCSHWSQAGIFQL